MVGMRSGYCPDRRPRRGMRPPLFEALEVRWLPSHGALALDSAGRRDLAVQVGRSAVSEDVGGAATGMGVVAASVPGGLDRAQKRRADRLISIFENSTPVIQYAYIENIRDGRGYTAG